MNAPSPVIERALRAEMRRARRLCSARDEQTQLDFDPDALSQADVAASPLGFPRVGLTEGGGAPSAAQLTAGRPERATPRVRRDSTGAGTSRPRTLT